MRRKRIKKRTKGTYYRLDEIFDIQKIGKDTLNKLFYLSLFDSSHFESPGFLYDIIKIKRDIIKLLRKIAKIEIKKDIEIIEKFISAQFFTGKITNIVLSEQLTKIFKKKIRMIFFNGHELDCFFGSKKLCLEIKRIFSTGNVCSYIEEEIERQKTINHPRIEKVLMVFIIIAEKKNEIEILLRATDGFKNLFSKLQKEKIIPGNFHF